MNENFENNLNVAFDSIDKINKLQDHLMKNHLRYCLENSPYYRNILKDFDLTCINSNNLSKLPFTDKTSIINYNQDFIACSYSDIRDVVLSSGTTASPVKITYTENDLERLQYNEFKSFLGCGLTQEDRVLLTCTMDRCFVAGLAYYLGLRRLGAATIRNGLNSLESHYDIMKRLKPTTLIGVPSFLKRLANFVRSRKENSDVINKVKKLICIGEPVRKRDFNLSTIGNELATSWEASIYSTYASSECITSFSDCEWQAGGHLHPDLAIIEIVDENNRTLSNGELGELVITPLQCEGLPLIRFKTGDITFLDESYCSCGRKTPRIGPIIGRKQQKLKFKGTTLYPQSIYSVLEEMPAISEYYVEVFSKEVLSDDIRIFISRTDSSLTKNSVINKLKSKLRISIPVYIETESNIKKIIFESGQRKPVRFFDKR